MRHSSIIALLLIVACTCLGAAWSEDPASRLKGNEKEAWKAFFAGVECLQEQGNRRRAADFFEQVANEFPESRYATDSKELAGLLRQMVEEDKRWTESHNPAALSVEARILCYTYHLRDVSCYQISQPGMCSVLIDFGQKQPGTNAAMKLKEIGEPAIPALIQLLDDRRPTRSVGYWRDFSPSRTVLRFQDAAIEILDELLPVAFYRRNSTAAYFSTESPEARGRVISSIKAWHLKSLGKSPVEQKWLAVEANPGVYPLMALLKDLALGHGQKQRVLATLRRMCDQRDPLQLPQISYLMCQLGDYGKVDAVASAYLAGQYDVGEGLPDDSAAGSNAQDYALRQVILYGTESQRETFKKNLRLADAPLSKGQALFRMLVGLAMDEWEELPKTYDRTRFPLQMLVEALASKEEWSNASRGSESWTIRRCDAAAEALQKFTGKQFGFDGEKSEAKKDEAIKRILTWWKDRERRKKR